MNKTDKELTAEIVIAMISANPRVVYKNDNQVMPTLSGESIVNLINDVYATLSKLESPK